MLYAQYMKKAIELVVIDDVEATGFVYLDPNYRVQLIDAKLTPDVIEDYESTWADVLEA